VLHRIAFPVVSDWYQQRHSCLTIVLGCGIHLKDIQHLARNTRIQPILDRYSRWMPSVVRNTADSMDKALG
jgi:cadmium resistance protein CadD (predicted permease)